MRLTARILKDVSSVNVFRPANQAEFTQGDSPTIYFQLVDASLDRADEGFQPPGRRYMPAASATLSVVLGHINDARKITRACFQPFASDPSIWALAILSTDMLRGTVNMALSLNESGKITQGLLLAALNVGCTDGMSKWT